MYIRRLRFFEGSWGNFFTEKFPQADKLWLWGLVCLGLVLGVLVLGENVYRHLYPPLEVGPKIDVAEVRRKIAAAGIVPRAARHFRIIEIDRQGKISEVERR